MLLVVGLVEVRLFMLWRGGKVGGLFGLWKELATQG